MMAYRQRSSSSFDDDVDRYAAVPPYGYNNNNNNSNNIINHNNNINNVGLNTNERNGSSSSNMYSAQDLHRFAQNADRFSTNRTGQWSGNGLYTTTSNSRMSAVATAAPAGSAGSSGSDGNLNSSQRGSQSALLLNVRNSGIRRPKWPKGKDFLFSTWAYVIGAHSLWEFPILTLKYGGVVFILVYLIMFLLLGVPMLLLEMTLGQYSSLSPTKLFRNICPALTGVGYAILITLLLHSLSDLAVVTWSSQAMYLLFTGQQVQDNFFYRRVLDVGEASDLGHLGVLHGQLALCLGIACVVVFIFIAAGTRSIGKISLLIVPLSYGLLMTLTIRACMSEGGPQGILTLLTPDWSHISQPWAWLEASRFVFLSLQLGLGVVSTYASYNKYHHNIIRDAGVISIGHFVWSVLSVLLVFALLGVADNSKKLNLDNLKDPEGAKMFVSITGNNFWLVGVTLAESALGSLEHHAWLWSGLLFCLVVLSTISSIMAVFETLAANVVDEFPSLRQYKPAISFTFLAAVFLLSLLLATQGGIHVYYVLTSYYCSVWPTLLFGLLAVLAAAFSHGGKYLMKDLGDMSKMGLTHFVSAHLSVLYSTFVPAFMAGALAWSLYKVSRESIEQPLVNFSMSLPADWGLPLGWSLAAVPVLVILLGFAFHLLWKSRGMPFKMHLKRSFKPTDTWYENEHRELMLLDSSSSPKDSPILAYKRGILGFAQNKNITEV